MSKWLLNAAALLASAQLYNGVQISSFGSAMRAALVVGLFNALLRPVLVVLTFPVTVLSLGRCLLKEAVGVTLPLRPTAPLGECTGAC